jgi:hypothetical protein
MAFDPILGAGWIPPSLPVVIFAGGDVTNNNLRITSGTGVAEVSTAPLVANMRVDLLQLDLSIVQSTAVQPADWKIYKNNVLLLQGSTYADNTLLPITVFKGTIGGVFNMDKGDVIRIYCQSSVSGGATITFGGGVTIYGYYV